MNVTIYGQEFALLHPSELVPWNKVVAWHEPLHPLEPRQDLAIQGERVSPKTARKFHEACHAYAKGGPSWERWQRENAG